MKQVFLSHRHLSPTGGTKAHFQLHWRDSWGVRCSAWDRRPAGLLGREMQCLGQMSVPVNNFSQIRPAVSEQIRPEQTDRQTDNKFNITACHYRGTYQMIITTHRLASLAARCRSSVVFPYMSSATSKLTSQHTHSPRHFM